MNKVMSFKKRLRLSFTTLRNQLEEIDYKLSGVLFENTIKKHIVENKKQLVYQTASSYSGVDVRI